MSCAMFGKGLFFLGAYGSYDHVFTPRSMRQGEDLKAQKIN